MAKAAEPKSNLELWESFETTDPEYTTQFNRGGFCGTAINPTYIAKRLTERFGPCGQGWCVSWAITAFMSFAV